MLAAQGLSCLYSIHFHPSISVAKIAKPVLVAAGWTPEEAARYELAILHGLAADKKAQRVYMQKVRVVEAVRAKARQQQVQLHGPGSIRAQARRIDGGWWALVGVAWAAARRRHGASCAAAKI